MPALSEKKGPIFHEKEGEGKRMIAAQCLPSEEREKPFCLRGEEKYISRGK